MDQMWSHLHSPSYRMRMLACLPVELYSRDPGMSCKVPIAVGLHSVGDLRAFHTSVSKTRQTSRHRTRQDNTG